MKTLLKNYYVFVLLLVSVFACHEEVLNPVVYSEQLYQEADVVKTPDIQYGSNASFNFLNLFQVPDNQDATRPLILLSPGGGFLYYNQTKELEDMAYDLARRGYVVATVYYTIDQNLNLFDQDATSRLWMQSMQDQKSAIRFFKKNAEEYRIDPDNVFIGGWSNGASVALTTAFLQEDEVSSIANTNMKDLVTARIAELGFEGSDNSGPDSNVKGALILNGYAFDKNFLNENDPALMIIYHEESHLNDGTIITNTFQAGTDTFYGINPLVQRAKDVGYVEDGNLASIIVSGNYNEPNYAPLDSSNYDKIADFFFRNLR